MITIYNRNETNFEHNGLGALMPTKCVVQEELNGMFELTLEHPIDARGKWENITEGNIIKAPTPRGNQLFRVYRKIKNMNSVVAYARHIFYDLIDNFIESVVITEQSGEDALSEILNSTQYEHAFTGESDISLTESATIERMNPIQAIFSDDENSFINKWGGELERDNFIVKMKSRLGADNGVTIRYRKNLIGLEVDIDESNVVTRVYPTAMDGEDVLELPEKYIDSIKIGNYSHPKIQHIHYTDLNTNDYYDFEIYAKLRDRVQSLFNVNKIDEPVVNVKVSFIELSKTEQYKNYAFLEKAELGDTVRVIHEPHNIDYTTRVVKTVWNTLSQKYDSIELGSTQKNIADTLARSEINIGDLQRNKVGYSAFYTLENSFIAEFNKIGLAGEQTGIVKADIDGIEVRHSDIDAKTRLSADGLKIYDVMDPENPLQIGGLMVIDGKVHNMSSVITNPDVVFYGTIGEVTPFGPLLAMPCFNLYYKNGSPDDEPFFSIGTPPTSPGHTTGWFFIRSKYGNKSDEYMNAGNTARLTHYQNDTLTGSIEIAWREPNYDLPPRIGVYDQSNNFYRLLHTGDLKIISFIASGSPHAISYPDGFTKENSIVLEIKDLTDGKQFIFTSSNGLYYYDTYMSLFGVTSGHTYQLVLIKT